MTEQKLILTDTRIVEYRIIVPCTLERYEIGKAYMVNMVTREEKTGAGDGIEILLNERYEEDNIKCQHTRKIYHLKSRIPKAIRWAIPDKYLHFHEDSVNKWPHIVTINTVPGIGDDFMLVCESDHVEYQPGKPLPENPLSLPEDQLAMREVVYLDIVGHNTAPEKGQDMMGFTCPELGITEPLTCANPKQYNPAEPPAWTENYKGPMLCVCKAIKFHFKWRGLQKITNSFVYGSIYPALFTNTHRKMMHWAKDWAMMSEEQIVALDQETEKLTGHDFERDEE